MSHSSDPLGHALISLCFGGYFFVNGIRRWREKRVIQNTPLSKVGSVAMGDAELAGEVKALSLVKTRFSEKDCVYCSYTIERRDRNSWRTEDKGERACIFLIHDGTGEILMNPTGATYYGAFTYQTIGIDGRRYTEYSVVPGQIVFVEGGVSRIRRVAGGMEREDKIIGPPNAGEFILSAYSEERLVSQFGWMAPLQIFGGAALLLGCLWYMVMRFGLERFIQ